MLINLKGELSLTKRKKMVFVLGPESSGTRGTTRFLIQNGNYWGSDSHIQPLDDFVYGKKTIEKIVPANINKIVFRRSVPHAGMFEDLNFIDTKFLNAGFKTIWCVVLRDLSEIVRSKVSRQNALDQTQAWMHTIYQFNWIFEKIASRSFGVYFFPYTSVVKNPEHAIAILKSFNIL